MPLAKCSVGQYCNDICVCVCVCALRKNMYAGGDNAQMNGDTPHEGGHGGGGHAVGDELKRTGK